MGPLGWEPAAIHVLCCAVRDNSTGTDLSARFTKGAAAEGDPGCGCVWDDERYRFAAIERRDMFKALPDRDAPQYPALWQCYCERSKGGARSRESARPQWQALPVR